MIIVGHKKQWEFLKRKLKLNQLSHSYLFTGQEGIGKKLFAIEFTKLINCLRENKPCDKCANCLAIVKNSFPDLMIISPEDGGEIPISKIRQAQNFLSYKSYYGSFKTVIVDDAEKMNQEAQSCFLKTLEEPKGKTLLILVSSKPDMLLPTILSRCPVMKFFKPKDLPENAEKSEKDQKILKDLLSVINLNLAGKFKYVKSLDFEKQKLGDILEVAQKYFRNILFKKTGAGKVSEKIFADSPILKDYPVEKIKNIINLTEDINNKLLFTNVNPKLALEILLMEI